MDIMSDSETIYSRTLQNVSEIEVAFRWCREAKTEKKYKFVKLTITDSSVLN